MTPTGLLLDEIAACERRVRGLQARQLALLAEYAEAVRDGLRPGECELTERMTPTLDQLRERSRLLARHDPG